MLASITYATHSHLSRLTSIPVFTVTCDTQVPYLGHALTLLTLAYANHLGNAHTSINHLPHSFASITFVTHLHHSLMSLGDITHLSNSLISFPFLTQWHYCLSSPVFATHLHQLLISLACQTHACGFCHSVTSLTRLNFLPYALLTCLHHGPHL